MPEKQGFNGKASFPMKIEIDLQAGFSSGRYEWKVGVVP
jgi:hypothetical protein